MHLPALLAVYMRMAVHITRQLTHWAHLHLVQACHGSNYLGCKLTQAERCPHHLKCGLQAPAAGSA